MRICVFAFSYWKYALRGGDGRPCKSARQGCGKPRMRNLVQNEPHAGGGNPVLAIDTLGDTQQTEAIFTDILGTSLGKIGDVGYSAIEQTVFGNADEKGFFTGKPYVDDLGYAFLFRNYRADIGKWLSQDLIGYPDGWNNYAYVNNKPITCIDILGMAAGDIYPSPDAAAEAWGKEYNGKSISENREYSSSIYQNGDGYSYTEGIPGNEGNTPVVNPPDGYTADSDIHSHGAYDPNYNSNNWGGEDLKLAIQNGRNAYLTTPDGRLLKYNPKTGEITTVSYTLPSDPKSPKPPTPPTPPTKPE